MINLLEKFINVSDTQNNNKYFKLKTMPIHKRCIDILNDTGAEIKVKFR